MCDDYNGTLDSFISLQIFIIKIYVGQINEFSRLFNQL